jgi:Na+-transporting methylmalonyl-CoA/oxaloacetate decarboxylase gamma subunit
MDPLLLSLTATLDALPHLVGMLLVISTLAILWGVCEFVATLVNAVTPKPAEVPAPAPAPSPDPTPVSVPNGDPGAGPAQAQAAEHSISPETVAIIAAAVAVVTGRNHRIISIKRQSSSQWESAGRHSVLTSHRIR